MKRKFLFVCSLALAATIGWAQITSDFTLTANPSLNIPLGPLLADGTPFYSIGGGISLKGEYSPPFAQFLYTGFAFDADLIPINSSTKTSRSFLSAWSSAPSSILSHPGSLFIPQLTAALAALPEEDEAQAFALAVRLCTL